VLAWETGDAELLKFGEPFNGNAERGETPAGKV
jgi:hypothetical protein